MKNIKKYEDFVNEEINLKKSLATGALAAGMAFSNPATSQITTTKAVQKTPIEVKAEVPKYDSTENFTPEIQKLIGQDFYLKKRNKDNYYDVYDFYEDFKKGYFKELKDTLDGSYLTLLDTISIQESKLPPYNKYSSGFIKVMKFKLKGTDRIVYYDYSKLLVKDLHSSRVIISKNYKFPFIVVGFFEKQKELLVGSILKSVGRDYQLSKNEKPLSYNSSTQIEIYKDINTGNNVIIKDKTWICTDLTVDESSNRLSLIFKNDNNYIMIPFDSFFGDINDTSKKRLIRTESEYNSWLNTKTDRGGLNSWLNDTGGVRCLSEDAKIKMYNGNYKMISQVKDGDELSTGIVKKLHITKVNDVISLVEMDGFFITPGHFILDDNRWIRPDSIKPIIYKYIDNVYNIELVNGDSFESNGVICTSLTENYMNGKKYRIFEETYL